MLNLNCILITIQYIHKLNNMSRKIVIKNLENAEDNAMLCALRSRSSAPITDHLRKVEETGSGKFMTSYYLGYSHRSIGQCGFTTIHLDNISILAAKAIEESALFNGQECSSRYLDFSTRKTYINHEIISDWLKFYTDAKEPLIKHLKEKNLNDGQPENVYEKAIAAKAFDILRGFLPAAVTTNVSWVTSLDHLNSQIELFKFHPLKEMNEIGNELHKLALEQYPNSFKDKELSQEEMNYNVQLSKYWYTENVYKDSDFKAVTNVDANYLDLELLNARPKFGEIPKLFKYFGDFRFEFNIDFGSFRDIQRHRTCLIYQPLLTAKLGFHPWYLAQLPDSLLNDAITLIESQTNKIADLGFTIKPAELQYYIPLGMKVSVPMIASLNALVYLLELRSSKHVHPTLRNVIFKMVEFVRQEIPELKLHIDTTLDSDFNIQRGNQDIVLK